MMTFEELLRVFTWPVGFPYQLSIISALIRKYIANFRCRTINKASAEHSNSTTTPRTNVGRSCLGRNKVTKYSPPIGNY